jgi:hypothetical protein
MPSLWSHRSFWPGPGRAGWRVAVDKTDAAPHTTTRQPRSKLRRPSSCCRVLGKIHRPNGSYSHCAIWNAFLPPVGVCAWERRSFAIVFRFGPGCAMHVKPFPPTRGLHFLSWKTVLLWHGLGTARPMSLAGCRWPGGACLATGQPTPAQRLPEDRSLKATKPFKRHTILTKVGES